MITDDHQEQPSAIPFPEGTGMVYLGMSLWQGMWKSRHQLMSRFSRKMPVLYVEPWITLQSIRRRGLGTGLARVLRDIFRPTLKRNEANVWVLRSSAARPVSGSRLLGRFTRGYWLRAVNRAALSAGITRPILWICRPEMGFAIGEFEEQLSIYHIVDEYTGYTGLEGSESEQLAALERSVLDKADLSVAASPELVDAKAAVDRDIVLLENGVSPRQFIDAREKGTVPDDINSIPKPRIGYCGLIGKRLNLELLREIATQRPDWSIVMIGKVDYRECEASIADFQSLPNVHFLGEKHPNDVARYITALDVGLLPYAINLETHHISPLKMYEYWAAGKPVVATGIPAARRNSSAVRVADSAGDFIRHVQRSLDDFRQSDKDYLLGLAERNSWQTRVDQIAFEISVRLGLRQAGSAMRNPTSGVASERLSRSPISSEETQL